MVSTQDVKDYDISSKEKVNLPTYNKDHVHSLVEEEYGPCGSENPLRVCCYGSSSDDTPMIFLKEAYTLGLTLARRGHTCVNGAGAWGCMAAMNEGADDGGGNIVGVIHEMFVVDGSDWLEGSHNVFHHDSRKPQKKAKREIIIAKGDDLQQRKKLLVTGADALVVLPGGIGTWDELWEMACSKNIGLTNIPIVCVNVDGYYKPFEEMLQLAFENKLIKKHPSEIVHFEPDSVKAIQWVEDWIQKQQNGINTNDVITVKRREPCKSLSSSSIISSKKGCFWSKTLSYWSSLAARSFFGGDNVDTIAVVDDDSDDRYDEHPFQLSKLRLESWSQKKIMWLPLFPAFLAGAFIGSTFSLKFSSKGV